MEGLNVSLSPQRSTVAQIPTSPSYIPVRSISTSSNSMMGNGITAQSSTQLRTRLDQHGASVCVNVNVAGTPQSPQALHPHPQLTPNQTTSNTTGRRLGIPRRSSAMQLSTPSSLSNSSLPSTSGLASTTVGNGVTSSGSPSSSALGPTIACGGGGGTGGMSSNVLGSPISVRGDKGFVGSGGGGSVASYLRGAGQRLGGILRLGGEDGGRHDSGNARKDPGGVQVTSSSGRLGGGVKTSSAESGLGMCSKGLMDSP